MFYKADPLIFERAKELRNNMTHTEMLMWGYLRTRPLGFKFRRQHPFYNYIADFYCHALQLIIEIDGSIHNQIHVVQNDRERNKIIYSLGLNILRFTNDQVLYKMDFVIEHINNCINNLLTKKLKEGAPTPPLGGWGVCTLL
ncbi:MAG: endonuclease domain-containing protein [Sphingobacteriales bacterium]|nr:MAG: endonuclease domain-containing protein [Sphingobacteriales bacterium]